MNSAIVVALVCLLGAASAQDPLQILQEQLNGPLVANILNSIPEGNACRANARAFINQCTTDLITTTSLKDDLTALGNLVQIGDQLKIKGGALSGYIDGATASDGCCASACKVARVGCMCDPGAWSAMQALFNLDGGNGVNQVFGKMKSKCSGVGGRNFEAVMDPSSAMCQPSYAETAKGFTC